jgi:lantibiotic modifying enzyme
VTGDFAKVAEDIGRQLCQKAYWHDLRCNWIGRSIDDMVATGSAAAKALSPELYEGTSGIALFMLNLYLAGGRNDGECRKAAEGAINQAISGLDEVAPISRYGLYSGHAGIACVAAIIGREINNPALTKSALEIVERMDGGETDRFLDVISGTAGAIPCMLKIHEITGESRPLALATDLGRDLINRAVKEEKGWSWSHKSSGLESAEHNLTGFSHGASGIGAALLELYRVTNENQFRDAAENAFQYENSWFSQQEKNWPDFRHAESSDAMPDGVQRYATGWCHGAPGITISRLRAFHILKKEEYLHDIEAGLYTTMKVARQASSGESYPNFSLCHGLAGIGEILLYAGEVLGNDECRTVASGIGKFGIDRYVSQKAPWPCDNRVGETPGLMIGLAGIGQYYLHLASPGAKLYSPLAFALN